MAVRTAPAKPSVSVMTWSAAKEPITASGSARSMSAAASPIAAMESRADGSARIASGASVSSWRATASRRAAPVTTSTRPGASGPSRSWVSWISVRPLPRRSCRNFGAPARLSGHRRVPAPPAGTTAQKESMGAWLVMGDTLVSGP